MKRFAFLVLWSLCLFVALYSCGAGKDSPEAVFASIDVDDDGKVVKEEFCALYADAGVCQEKFEFFDKNGDGYVALDEFVTTHE
jgi:Ca2+-binding EF-hand superfamily protein